MTLACSNCGTQNADGTTQCTRCGAQLPAQGFGAAPVQQGFGAPPAQQGFGAPAQQAFGAPAQQQGFGAPPAQQGFGAPPAQQGFGAPAQQAFGAPPAQQGFGAPPGPPPSGYAPPGGYTPPPSGGGGMAGNGKWIAIGCGSLLVLCCCSGIALQLASGGLTSYLQQASTVPEAPLPPVGPVDPGLPFPTSEYAPVGYPPGFPYLPGGAPDPTTTSGTIIVLYTDSPGVIFERFVSAIPDNGWEMMMGTDMSEGGYRFAATRDGRVVRLMAMPEGSGTMLGVHED